MNTNNYIIFTFQAKLRRMVEEHSTNLSSRIDPEYPSSVPALSPSCQKSELKLSADSNAAATANDSKLDSTIPPEHANTEQKDASCDLDVKTAIDYKKDTFKTSRPNSVESKRSKSLGNAASVDSTEDSKNKKDVKKTKSNPVKIEATNQESEKAADENNETSMTIEENASPGRNASSEAKSSERSESPKPGCSSQQDLGKQIDIGIRFFFPFIYITLNLSV